MHKCSFRRNGLEYGARGWALCLLAEGLEKREGPISMGEDTRFEKKKFICYTLRITCRSGDSLSFLLFEPMSCHTIFQTPIQTEYIPEVILLSKLPVQKAAAYNKVLTKFLYSTTQGWPHLHYLCYAVYHSENINHVDKHSICLI
jgi:hypothetical protein